MLLSLEQIFSFIAKDKGIKNQEEWVKRKLDKCELHSDYFSYLHLKSHRNMWFGVKDAKFDCQDFVLYREYKNNDSVHEFKEFEIYTFDSINDLSKLDFFFRESYQYSYDMMKDFRLYFQTSPIKFKVVLPDGSSAKLGQYNDLDDGYKVKMDIYTISLKDDVLPSTYCKTIDQLVLKVIAFRDFCKLIEGQDINSDKPVYYDTSAISVTKNDKPVKFELYKLGNEWKVNVLN